MKMIIKSTVKAVNQCPIAAEKIKNPMIINANMNI